ncbi:hypothetical protein [Vogesella indigofera]|uniref:hypothetical protein n=1 Tax=Vogesella indigofera TaxID=45465 RepID=UPI00234F49AF|nr:hypothetical protein [Vogesella indigofera]MDC7701414.1 hypothetical protein [Vogesella indigofera]
MSNELVCVNSITSTMYNVSKMKSKLADAVTVVESDIRAQFAVAFKSLYRDGVVPDGFPNLSPPIDQVHLTSPEDLKRVYSGQGFYVILSDRPVDGNRCQLNHGTLRAIYRGECRTVRKRIQSHLFNAQYNANYEERSFRYVADQKKTRSSFYEPHWPHCLKLDLDGPSGVDIDQAPHSDYKWFVLVHRMKDSSQRVRQLAELAFDDVFGHPAGSRDT